MTHYHRSGHDHPAFIRFCQELDREFAARYPAIDYDLSVFNLIGNNARVIVAVNEEHGPVGCGCFRPLEPEIAEIKRMYVQPAFRGQRIATTILFQLEQWARQDGFAKMKLETGARQPEAQALYRKAGYTEIPSYPPYSDAMESLCLAKDLY
jgi:GNAT superfamily N-acetyltransferase